MVEFSIALLLGIVVMVTYGVQDYLIAYGSRKLGFVQNAAWFLALQIAMLLVLSIFFFTYPGINLYTISVCVLAGFFGAISLLLYSKGLRSGNISIVATIASVWGAVTAILGIVFFHETLSNPQILYISIIIIGTILVSFEAKNMLKKGMSNKWSWINYSVLALFGYGIFFFLISDLSKMIGWFDTAIFVTVSSFLFILVYVFITRTNMKIGKSYMPLLIVISVLGLIGLFAYNIGTQYSYTSIISPISAAAPVITIILAMLILKERMATSQKIGMIMVILGLMLLAV